MSESVTKEIPSGKRILSGIQPSGQISLGNYFGAMKQHLELQENNECFYFIANYHALTTVKDGALAKKLERDVAVAYLALGLDPNRTALYRQSDLKEVCELTWILSTLTGLGLLDRAHSYKDKVAQGISASVGLYTYPILMAADILITECDFVPVGEDQIQHLEMTRDMAGYFNNTYKTDVLKPPRTLLSETPKVPGVDGRKMSKSYGNTIEVFAPVKQSRKRIMAVVTDSTPVEEAKNPETCNVFSLLKLFARPAELDEWAGRYRKPPMGYGEAKLRLFELYEEHFAEARELHTKLLEDPDFVEDVLRDGAKRVKAVAEPLMERVRSACGL